MKVLLINSICGYGSTGRICTGIQSVLEENGDECLICYGRGQAPENSNSYRIGSQLDVNIHGLISRLDDRHGLYSSRATKRLVAKIKEFEPDVINLHNIHGYFLNYKILFEFLADYNKPVVWTLHDCWSFTGHCAHFYNNNCDKWLSGCNNCAFKWAYPKTIGVCQSGKNFELKKKLFTGISNLTLVSPSSWLAELAKQSFFKDCDVRVINNGINRNDFKPVNSDFREKNNLSDKKVILGVSNAWGHLKGLDTFDRLARELDDTFKIVLVGLTAENEKNLSDKIIKIRKTANVNELAEIYSAADVYLNPTLQDNFPTVNIESLACGTPVITYDSGGSGEMLDSSTGFVVERGNYESLKKTIIELDSIPFSSDACVKSAQKYDQILKFKQYRELYDELS